LNACAWRGSIRWWRELLRPIRVGPGQFAVVGAERRGDTCAASIRRRALARQTTRVAARRALRTATNDTASQKLDRLEKIVKDRNVPRDPQSGGNGSASVKGGDATGANSAGQAMERVSVSHQSGC